MDVKRDGLILCIPRAQRRPLTLSSGSHMHTARVFINDAARTDIYGPGDSMLNSTISTHERNHLGLHSL